MANPKRRKCTCGKKYVRKGHDYCILCESAHDPLPPPSLRDIEKATISKEAKTSQVIFGFRNRASKKKKNAILEKISSWKEVKSVERVFDSADSNASSAELYVVYVKVSSQTDSIINRLQTFAEIKYAYLPPTRRLK